MREKTIALLVTASIPALFLSGCMKKQQGISQVAATQAITSSVSSFSTEAEEPVKADSVTASKTETESSGKKNDTKDSAAKKTSSDKKTVSEETADNSSTKKTGSTANTTVKASEEKTAGKSSGSASKTSSNQTASSNNTSTEEQSSSSSSKSSDQESKTQNSSAEIHTHTWVEQKKTIHHDAVTGLVWVVDQAAYDEPKYEEQIIYDTYTMVQCRACGEEFSQFSEWDAHSDYYIEQGDYSHGSYSVVTHQVQTGTQTVPTGEVIHHAEVGHWETQVVQSAYDEEKVVGYKCSCGAAK